MSTNQSLQFIKYQSVRSATVYQDLLVNERLSTSLDQLSILVCGAPVLPPFRSALLTGKFSLLFKIRSLFSHFSAA